MGYRWRRESIPITTMGSSVVHVAGGQVEVEFDIIIRPHPYNDGFHIRAIYECAECGRDESDVLHERPQVRLI